MNKPTFILFMGLGWCGTTSLYNTLKVNKYIHTGYCKETFKLFYIDNPEFKNNFGIGRSKNELSSEINEARKYPLTSYDNYIKVLSKIPPILEEEMNGLPTLEKYIEYYKILSDNRNPYHAVGDFSNVNIALSKNFLIQLKSSLEEHFNVKCLCIHRDRVRYVFSMNNHFYFNLSANPKEKNLKEKYYDFIKYFLSSDFMFNFTPNNKDTELFENYNTVFGKENIHHVIMEKFFSKDPEEVALLEDFLEYKLPNITPCCFVPDKGINSLKLEGLKDQWNSDHEILTPGIYSSIRKKLEYYYKYDREILFKNRLPSCWEEVIDYGY